MATIPVVPISPPSTIAGLAASQGGDAYENDGGTLVFIFNNSSPAHDIDVTRVAQTQPEAPLDCENDVVTCAGGLTILPPVAPRWFNDPTGLVRITYPTDEAVNITLVAIRVARAR